MAHRPGERLLGAWAPREFAAAVESIARASGLSKSALIREALRRAALDAARKAEDASDA